MTLCWGQICQATKTSFFFNHKNSKNENLPSNNVKKMKTVCSNDQHDLNFHSAFIIL